MARVITRGRVLTLVGVLVIAVVAWLVWLAFAAYHTYQDLDRAQGAVESLEAAVEADDVVARDAALADLQSAAADAHGRTDGLLWGAAGLMPGIGDDVRGVEALSASLDLVANEGLAGLLGIADSFDTIVSGERIDTEALAALQGPVSRAHGALEEAVAEVADRESSGFVEPLREQFDEYADRLTPIAGGLGAAETAVEVLPAMLGADGPRDYLFLFQNNAELRATGGIAGSWAQVHAEDGLLTIERQGSSTDFPVPRRPVGDLTGEERAIFGSTVGLYWQNPGSIPDFPRAAELFDAHWDGRFPQTPLDGVLALDPVAASYLLGGTGPIDVAGTTLDETNIVDLTLSGVYLNEPDPEAQDAYFRGVAAELLAALTRPPQSPLRLVEGLARAADEGRFLVAPFDEVDATRLAGTQVLGALAGDDGATPHVDIGLDDATISKMSYYLRQTASVESVSCEGGRQLLRGTLTLDQTIPRSEARTLPEVVTGGGEFGVPPGLQLVAVRIYAPYGGRFESGTVAGDPLRLQPRLELDGRPVEIAYVELDGNEPTEITWDMTTGPGQTGDAVLRSTPSVEPGRIDERVPSSC